ncbi:MAG: glycosyltransferase [Planctomycetota bacterium]
MRILVVAPHPFYIDRGTPIDVDILVRALCEQGHEVHLATLHAGADRDYPGLTIHRIREPNGVGMLSPGFSRDKLRCDARLFGLVWKLVKQLKPDVLHAGEEAVFIATAVKRRFGIPYVYDMDSSIAQQMVEQNGSLSRAAGVFNWFERQAIRGAVACAPVCNALADLAREQGAQRLVTLHDISQLDVGSLRSTGWLREKLGITSGVVVVYCGNLQPYQGVDLLVEATKVAADDDADIHTVIAGGDDDHIAEYEAKCTRIGIHQRVRFIGRWPADKLGDLLIEGDILAAPRIRGINTPQKVFPYLHTGKPVIVTDLPTHSQILDQSVCRLAPPDRVSFGRALKELAQDEAERARLGDAGRRFAESQHTYPSHAARVAELYGIVRDTLESGQTPAAEHAGATPDEDAAA